MSLEDLEKAQERYKLAKWIGEELVLMYNSGRLDPGYRKYVKDDPTNLAYHFIEKLETSFGYIIERKALSINSKAVQAPIGTS